MSSIYDQKPVKNPDDFSTVTVTRDELIEIVRTGAPFRTFLESKGIVHRKGIHVGSETPGNKPGIICYRNYRHQTDSQIAGEETGIGRIR